MARPRTTSDEAIMQATGRAIGRHGPANLTLAVVAEEAGLAPATLVQRFGSKHGLLLAFAGRGAHAVAESFRQARQEHDSPLAAMHAALAGMTSGVRTAPEMANHIGFLQMDLADPLFREHAANQAHRMREEIVRLLDDAAAMGELAEGVDTPRLARSIQITYNGVLILWALTGDGSLNDALRADIDQLLQPVRRQGK